MYFIAITGLWKLWQSRKEFAQANADRLLIGNAFIGFGIWHILDSILSHWILGIHRIRLDAENVLLWDLLWFFIFGVAFVVIGILIRMKSDSGGTKGRNTETALMLALLVVVTGPIAVLPPKNVSTVIVFFKPGITPADIFKAIDAADGRIIWSARSGDVWALDVKDKSKTAIFYQHGAYLVSNSALAIGCLAWSSARI